MHVYNKAKIKKLKKRKKAWLQACFQGDVGVI